MLPFESNLSDYATSASNMGTNQETLNAQNWTKIKVEEQAKQTTTVTNPRESRAIAIIAANMAIKKGLHKTQERPC